MRKFLEEFKKFAVKGNVVDLAVAVVIGAAFGNIVSSLVDNVVMPIAGVLVGGVSFRELSFAVGNAEVTYGIFLQTIIDFIIIALAIFIAVKVMNRLQQREAEKPEEEKMAPPTEDILLLREIRDSLKNKKYEN